MAKDDENTLWGGMTICLPGADEVPVQAAGAGVTGMVDLGSSVNSAGTEVTFSPASSFLFLFLESEFPSDNQQYQ
ncbi:hypothetical protein AQUCO_06100056v1 [Aquilegia coerulea]|uniref:Uncharacterized protein n=1 Tax=Aquilegia coerulea TaxID=218851 RepID=A0A2G5CDB0_AQUCA|nr:hypothetical protein AQUCO_06100056v1 [Aquilegia coerulea]